MDEFYKIVFAFPRMVRDLVRGFLPEQLTRDLDLEKPELLPTAYVSDSWQKRYGDRVWKIPYREGSDHPPGAYAVLLLEFQSEVDSTMPIRMLVYTGLLLQEILRQRGVLSGELKLPRTIPVVIYNGRRPWNAPLSVTEMTLDGDPETVDFQPRLTYWPLDERRQSSDDLPKDNLMSLLIALETSQAQAIDQALAGFATLGDDPVNAQVRRTLREWMERVHPLRELARGRSHAAMLTEEPMTLLESVNERLRKWYDELERQAIERGTARGMELGMAQGMAQGIEKGIEQGAHQARQQLLAEERALLRLMAERRFGSVVAERVASVLAETSDNKGFATVGEAIADSGSGSDLLRRMATIR